MRSFQRTSSKPATPVRPEEIYEALFDDGALARLPDMLAQAANARSTLMFWQHTDGLTQTIAYSQSAPAWFNDYATFAELDPYRALALQERNLNRVVLVNNWVTPSAFQNSIIYNDLIRRNDDDTVYCMGSAFVSPWGNGIIGVHRGKHHAPFELEDAARLRQVAVHAERVLRARGEMLSARRAATLAQNALDSVGLAILTVLADGRILQSNEAAEDVLDRADGLIVRHGLLAAAQATEQKLAQAIAKATTKNLPAATALAIPRGSDEPAYLLTVTPVTGRIGKPAALILFRDPSRPDSSLASRLRALFNVTRSEAAIAIDLAGGLSPAEIAKNRGVSMNTLRTQLKSLHAKTDCRRQAEFVSLMRNLPPL